MMLDACRMIDYMVDANESMYYVREMWEDVENVGSVYVCDVDERS